ncbi:MAG: homoserine O-acetyltransferase [Muribaculaceae bacterium]|nr:homoserine O-acetyltransferase [Muribaculaceae bacterium]
MIHSIHFDEPLELECGGVLPGVTVAYSTFGTMSPERDNVIWVCHAQTANSDVPDWWAHTVEKGRFLDPERYFVVCANILGSPYGTTCPMSINPATGEPWYGSFPHITIRDMVHCHMRLARHLGIDHVEMLIGSSMGGYQCMEWTIMEPAFTRRLALIATCDRQMPWAIAFSESQRMAIRADQSWGEPRPDAAAAGLAAARSVAMLSFRGREAYNISQDDPDRDTKTGDYRVSSYQRYQGKKLANRFDAYSYTTLLNGTDSHNVARGRGSVQQALSAITAPTLIVAITTDNLFSIEGHGNLIKYIPNNQLHIIESDYGHDGFLVEHNQLNDIITTFYNETV